MFNLRTFSATVLIPLTFFLPGCGGMVSKFAFYPDAENVLPADSLPSEVEEAIIETSDATRLVSLYLPSPDSDQLVIFFHGNAGNIYHRLPSLLRLRESGINVLGVSYRGYGKSQGKPSEKGLYLDGEAVLGYAVRELGFDQNNITLFGRSIGSTVATELAQNKDIKGLILVTPLSTGKAMAKNMGLGSVAFFAGKSFDNLTKIERLKAPLLVIHGTEDQITPIEMGEAVFGRANTQKEFIKIEGGDHITLSEEFETEYWDAITQFLEEKK